MRARDKDRLHKRAQAIYRDRELALRQVYDAYNTMAINFEETQRLLGLLDGTPEPLPRSTTYRKLAWLRDNYNGEQQEMKV